MKLAALINAFNNTSMLLSAVESIRGKVDLIIISASTHSHYGKEITNIDKERIESIKGVELIWFKPKIGVTPHENSKNKVQQRIEKAKDMGCSHFLLMAEDHFYTDKQFQWAKKSIETYDPDITLSKMYTYYKHPTWQLYPIEDYFMPFICKLYADTLVTTLPYPYKVDPSVRVKPSESFLEFHEDELMLHHFSMVRDSIYEKLNNSAASQNWRDTISEKIREYEHYDLKENKGIKYFKGRKVKLVDNYFGL